MAIVHSYARFSSEKQKFGDSEKRQKTAAEDYCERHKHTLSDLVFFDRGKSGFRGNKQKALAAFLKAIKDGRVKPGDILLVEAVDRLSRKGIRETQTLVNSILDAGVDIAILSPIEKVYRAKDNNDIGGAIELAAFAYQAHVYSQLLSGRIKSWWRSAREDYSKGKRTTLSAVVPTWLNRVGSKEDGYSFEVIEEHADAIRYAFQRTIQGIGGTTLTKELNEKYKPFRTSKSFNKTFVRNLIRDRAVTGEYTPHVIDEEGKRVPDGDPIPDFYPEIIDEKTWQAANGSMDNRFRERGASKDFINLFTGLTHFPKDECPAHVYTFTMKRSGDKRATYRRFKGYKHTQGIQGATTATIDVANFEKVFLQFLTEVDVSVFSQEEIDTVELQATQGQLTRKRKRLKELTAGLTDDKKSVPELVAAIEVVKSEINTLADKVRVMTKGAHSPRDAAKRLKSLAELEHTPENRQRLREAIKQVISRIDFAPVKMGTRKRDPILTRCEITFKNGSRRSIVMFLEQAIVMTEDNPKFPAMVTWTKADFKQWEKFSQHNPDTFNLSLHF